MPQLSRAELAEQYGWAMSVLRSSHELWSLFNRAVRHQWEGPRFAAELRQTNWFRRHAESWRKAQVLKRVDPGEWKARRDAMYANLRDQAQAMGAHISYKGLSRMSINALQYGWTDAQLKNHLADYVKWSSGRLMGEAGTNATALKQTALNNGYKIADSSLDDWARAMARGDRTLQDYQQFIREQTATLYPTFASELKAGMDLKDMAQPYIDTYAQTLEVNPNDVTMFDPLLRKALAQTDPATGKTTTMTMYDFENMLRRTARWGQTKQAQDLSTSVVRDLLKMWGASA